MTAPRTPDLAIFDLCDTLYAQNTTTGFVRFFLRREGSLADRLSLDLALSRASPLHALYAAAYRLGGIDLFRPAVARSLAGWDNDTLVAAARDYAAQVLPGVRNAATHALLERHRAAGDRVVIVSNSLDIVVEAVAARLGVEWRASELGFAGGRCTGRIVRDLSGRKAAEVAALAASAIGNVTENVTGPTIHAYTDNLSDRDLVEMADRATIVIPAGGSRRRWGSVDADFLEL